MEKKEAQKVFRNFMKSRGFFVKGNYSHKFLGDDYLVGVWLDHHPFCAAYFVEYGVIYSPDEKRLPFSGWCDWDERFVFAIDPNTDLRACAVETKFVNPRDPVLTDYFEYTERTAEDFLESLRINMERKVQRVYDRNFALEQYKEDWILFRMIPYETVRKICALTGIDAEEAIRIRDSFVTKWPVPAQEEKAPAVSEPRSRTRGSENVSLICFCAADIKGEARVLRYRQQLSEIAEKHGRGISFSVDWEEPIAEHLRDSRIVASLLDAPDSDICEMLLLPDGWRYNDHTNSTGFRERMSFLQDIAALQAEYHCRMDFYIGESGAEPDEFLNVGVYRQNLTEYLVSTIGKKGIVADMHICILA